MEVSSSPSTKMWNFVFFFARRQITDACLFVFFLFVLLVLFFFTGVIVSTQWSENLARGPILTEMKSSSVLFQRPKNWRAPRPPLTLIILPKSPDHISEIAILFSVVEKPSMSLGTTYFPTVPVRGASS